MTRRELKTLIKLTVKNHQLHGFTLVGSTEDSLIFGHIRLGVPNSVVLIDSDLSSTELLELAQQYTN